MQKLLLPVFILTFLFSTDSFSAARKRKKKVIRRTQHARQVHKTRPAKAGKAKTSTTIEDEDE